VNAQMGAFLSFGVKPIFEKGGASNGKADHDFPY